MDIIKVKAKAQREILADLLADAIGIPEDVRKDLMEMSDIQTDLFMRLRKDKALSHEAVKRYNELCYKHFGNTQDGGEFTKEEAPKEKPKGNKVSYPERKTVYEAAIEKYGIKPQLLMVIEEMSELTKALCKYFRDESIDLTQIADETADVTIMLEQLRLIFNLNDQVCEHMDMKVNRLAGRLGMF